MYNKIRQALLFRTKSGIEPYAAYVEPLKDRIGAAKIRARVVRAELGNLGDHRSVGHGIIEMRVHYGPGYRIYVGLDGKELIVLLCAGDKASQYVDIRKAQEYWRDYKDR